MLLQRGRSPCGNLFYLAQDSPMKVVLVETGHRNDIHNDEVREEVAYDSEKGTQRSIALPHQVPIQQKVEDAPGEEGQDILLSFSCTLLPGQHVLIDSVYQVEQHPAALLKEAVLFGAYSLRSTASTCTLGRHGNQSEPSAAAIFPHQVYR